eukprot:356645-Amorphochlora_amoeboformis.AAC.1
MSPAPLRILQRSGLPRHRQLLQPSSALDGNHCPYNIPVGKSIVWLNMSVSALVKSRRCLESRSSTTPSNSSGVLRTAARLSSRVFAKT